jgi:hypothetical protein
MFLHRSISDRFAKISFGWDDEFEHASDFPPPMIVDEPVNTNAN